MIRYGTSEWIDNVDMLRQSNRLLGKGHWHGYTAALGGEAPMRGAYYLVRWNAPTVAVSHDDPDEVVKLAEVIEVALSSGPSGRVTSRP